MLNWFRFSKNKEEETVGKKSGSSVIIPISSGSMLDAALRGGGISSYKAMRLYRKNSSLATAVDMIASTFEQIQPVLVNKDGKIFKDEEVIKLLKQPNGFQSWSQLAGDLSRHYLLTADSHISGLGSVNRPPLELFSVKPQVVNTTTDIRDLFPATYDVNAGAGRGRYKRIEKRGSTRFLDGALKEIYHIMGFSSSEANVNGDSLIQAIALEISQKIKGLNHNLKLIENGGRLSLIVSFKDESGIDDDEHQERKQRINEDLSGETNAGRVAVISAADVNIEEVGKSNKDMDYSTLDNIATQAIYLRYKIPLPLISNDASTFNNFNTAIGLLYDQAVLPLADIIFAGLSKFLLPRYGVSMDDWKISYDPLSIPALKTRMLAQLAEQSKMNIETTNELRAGIGRDPVDGGDTIYQAANLIPLGEDVFGDEPEVDEL